ncbi:hypothetical protein ACWGH4_32000, partial [Streptomyces sp. NPDC054847]
VRVVLVLVAVLFAEVSLAVVPPAAGPVAFFSAAGAFPAAPPLPAASSATAFFAGLPAVDPPAVVFLAGFPPPDALRDADLPVLRPAVPGAPVAAVLRAAGSAAVPAVLDVDFRGADFSPEGSRETGLPDVAPAAAERADAVFPAVFFATMAAAPSHIVILLANRAGTINRPQPRGNGARRRFGPPRAARSRDCIGCAQLSAR